MAINGTGKFVLVSFKNTNCKHFKSIYRKYMHGMKFFFFIDFAFSHIVVGIY